MTDVREQGDVKKTISIAILVAGTVSQSALEAFGNYEIMFRNLFTEALATIPRHEWHPKVSLYIQAFNIQMGEFPDIDQFDEGKWDALLVTGSPNSATSQGEVWMDVLIKYLQHVAETHPLVRIIGTCFGHQLIARAFGAEVVSDPDNAEIELTEEGTRLLSPLEPRSTWALEQTHFDRVTTIPPPFDDETWSVLGSTKACSIQGLVLRYATEAPPLPSSVGTSSYVAFDIEDIATPSSGPFPIRSAHILTLQAHPEFNIEVAKMVIQDLRKADRISEEVASAALERAALSHDGTETGRLLLAMLGVEPATVDVPLE